MDAMTLTRSVVVMGVSGSGKSTVAEALALRLGARYVDADALHPPANVAKMVAGIPLDDDDRRPWLDAVGAVLAEGGVVVACSALKRAYRDRLRAASPDLVLVHLRGDPALLAARMRGRNHFMPVTLLESQLATLEPPTADEHPIVLDIARTPDELVALAAAELET